AARPTASRACSQTCSRATSATNALAAAATLGTLEPADGLRLVLLLSEDSEKAPFGRYALRFAVPRRLRYASARRPDPRPDTHLPTPTARWHAAVPTVPTPTPAACLAPSGAPARPQLEAGGIAQTWTS